MRLDSVMLIDHFQNVFLSVIWDKELTWLPRNVPLHMSFSTTRCCSATSHRGWGGCVWALG